ncbi:MAG: cryptochrome/photolyase family protein [Gammaproteobacteria bacterium]|nr:cryptochrome/photolyase family protein [Gammaproteobacteria bacterium]
MTAGHRLGLILGDQLSPQNPLLTSLTPGTDRLLMVEAPGEATRVWSGKARIVMFLAAMRHYAAGLASSGFHLSYLALEDHRHPTLEAALAETLAIAAPRELVVVQPGEYGVATAIAAQCRASGVPLRVLPDPHFMADDDDFARWADGRSNLVMEHFYRAMRRRHGILMDDDGKPAGGAWNFDRANRQPFPRRGPGLLPRPLGFAPDATTREVMDIVERRFAAHPGRLEHFNWPVTTADARRALADFIAHRLASFGPHQDAMWTDEAWLYHATLSAALNLHLLDPREVMDAALEAYHQGQAPIASVEGFVRQILGWREYVRGIYGRFMPDYLEMNHLGARADLPAFYWNADTRMHCLAQAVGQTLDHGYAHHIQRLMVTGLFAMLYGVQPRQVHEWYLAVYVDAVEWVELPNTLGMSQHADGGLMASKPYAASGKYIQRMSNYCAACPFDSRVTSGATACPFNILYWDFLLTHRRRFAHHPRTALQWRAVERLSPQDVATLRAAATALREHPP